MLLMSLNTITADFSYVQSSVQEIKETVLKKKKMEKKKENPVPDTILDQWQNSKHSEDVI